MAKYNILNHQSLDMRAKTNYLKLEKIFSQAKFVGCPSHENFTWEAAKDSTICSKKVQTCQGHRHSQCSGELFGL